MKADLHFPRIRQRLVVQCRIFPFLRIAVVLLLQLWFLFDVRFEVMKQSVPPKKPSEIRPDIPPEVDAIIMRMLELEPSMRYPTYQSLLGDFKRYLAKAGPAKAGKSSGPKLKFKGMKPKAAPSATVNTTVDGEVADLQPIDDLNGGEEEKKGMGVGAMVGMVVGGIVLVVNVSVKVFITTKFAHNFGAKVYFK